MNELRISFTLLALYLLALFAVGEVFDDYGLIFKFPSHFYFLLVAVVGVNLFVPRLSWMSVTALMGFWSLIFFVVASLYVQVNGTSTLQILGIEFILIQVAVWMSCNLNSQMRAVETLMENLASATYTNRTLDLRQAAERIKVEMTRSRRHHRPLSVILIEPEKITANEDQQAYKLMREDLLRHFAAARIGQIMTNEVRQTDLILRAPEGHFIVLCTETPRENSIVLAERLQEAIQKGIGASVLWSVASFPDEALTFEELLNKAQSELGKSRREASLSVKVPNDEQAEKR